MKRILSVLILTASVAAPVSAFAFDFSTVVGVDKELKIVERVENKSIFPQIREHQSYNLDVLTGTGKVTTRVYNEQAIVANSDVVIGLCQAVHQLAAEPTDKCGAKSEGRTRMTAKPVK